MARRILNADEVGTRLGMTRQNVTRIARTHGIGEALYPGNAKSPWVFFPEDVARIRRLPGRGRPVASKREG